MSKTFMYLIATIAVYLVIVKGLGALENADDDNESDNGMNANEDEHGVPKGESGQQRYRIGVPYSNRVQNQSYRDKQNDLKDEIKNSLSYTI